MIGRADLRASLVGRALTGARFIPVWLATGVLLVVALAVAPDTLSGESFSVILPSMTFLAVAALGQLLVVMTGGIDLSIPGVIVLAAYLIVGVSNGTDGRLAPAILVCLAVSALVGLVNGVLVGVARLNPLIVTLAVGLVAAGIATQYSSGIASESAVPPGLSAWATDRFLGANLIFWVGLGVMLAAAVFLTRTGTGRRFQAIGSSSRAAWVAGLSVRRYVVSGYAVAGLLYGAAGILLAGFIRNPSLDLGSAYLLGPLAAVVIGGASLAGGVGSASSTWVAAFALTVLSQMLRVLGLSSALQYVVYGAAIALGMVISGERVASGLGRIAVGERLRDGRPGAGRQAEEASR